MTENKKITLYKITIEDVKELDKNFLIEQIDSQIQYLEGVSSVSYEKIINKTLDHLQAENDKKWFGKREISFDEAENICNENDSYLKLFVENELENNKKPYLKLKVKILSNSRIPVEEILDLGLLIEKEEPNEFLLNEPELVEIDKNIEPIITIDDIPNVVIDNEPTITENTIDKETKSSIEKFVDEQEKRV